MSNRNDLEEIRRSIDMVMTEWVLEVTGQLMDRWVKDGVVSDALLTKWRIAQDIDEVAQDLDSDLSRQITKLLDMVEDIENKNDH